MGHNRIEFTFPWMNQNLHSSLKLILMVVDTHKLGMNYTKNGHETTNRFTFIIITDHNRNGIVRKPVGHINCNSTLT